MKKKFLYPFFLSALVLSFATSLFLVSYPKAKSHLYKLFSSYQEKREILSILTGDIFRNGQLFKVVKVKEENNIYLEIYQSSYESTKKIDRISMENSNDGYFYFKRQSTNLALADLDKDGSLEILAPSYDQNHSPHLEIYQMNRKTLKLETFKKDYNLIKKR